MLLKAEVTGLVHGLDVGMTGMVEVGTVKDGAKYTCPGQQMHRPFCCKSNTWGHTGLFQVEMPLKL